MKTVTTSLLLLVLWLGLTPNPTQASEQVLALADGTAVKVLFFEPKTNATSPRLALLISSASSNNFMARAQFWLGKELLVRGWAVAVPISPDRTGFGGDNARLLPELVSQMQPSLGLSEAKPLLVGISSGGSTALSIASKYPGVFGGVVATPGRLQDDQDLAGLDGLPVYLRIGEKDDFRWNRQLDAMVVTLRDAGAVVDAAIVTNARHIFQLDWDNLEAWLATLK